MRRAPHRCRGARPGPAVRLVLGIVPDAVRRARLDPVLRRLRRLPFVLHELRAAREFPRRRCRVPASPVESGPDTVGRRTCCSRSRVHRAVPGERRPHRRPASAPGLVRAAPAADVDLAAADLRAVVRRDGVHRAGRRPAVRPVRAPRGLPARHRRQRARHRRVLGHLVRCTRRRCGGGWPSSCSASRSTVADGRRCGSVAAIAMVAVLGVLSFAPDTWWSPYYRVHLGDQAEPGSVRPARERAPPPGDHADRRAAVGAAVPVRRLRPRPRQRARRRADRRVGKR